VERANSAAAMRTASLALSIAEPWAKMAIPAGGTNPVLNTMIAMPKELKEGDIAPEIKLMTDQGEPFQLSKLKGKTVVLYFYPKADTPGCTKESCEFGEAQAKFTRKKAVIVGVSPDAVKSQEKFKTKYGLPFTLLADVEHKTAEAYGVWKQKSMYGRTYMGIERSTFVVGPDGKIAKIYRKVTPAGHAEQVLAAL
jgi:peroxiredoxin Q/BCP